MIGSPFSCASRYPLFFLRVLICSSPAVISPLPAPCGICVFLVLLSGSVSLSCNFSSSPRGSPRPHRQLTQFAVLRHGTFAPLIPPCFHTFVFFYWLLPISCTVEVLPPLGRDPFSITVPLPPPFALYLLFLPVGSFFSVFIFFFASFCLISSLPNGRRPKREFYPPTSLLAY